MTKEHLRTIVQDRLTEIDTALSALPDETAIDVSTLFPEWKPGQDYTLDYRLRHLDKLYRVVQPHTSQTGWEPDKTPALFVEISKPGEIDVWKQPAGAHDAYRIGVKVYYPTKADHIYVNTVDYNIYAPDVSGWELVE